MVLYSTIHALNCVATFQITRAQLKQIITEQERNADFWWFAWLQLTTVHVVVALLVGIVVGVGVGVAMSWRIFP
jgi:ABC-type proline/glycine betaine transport system permease subunit